MQDSLLFVALLIVAFWIVIMGLYLATAKKQVSIETAVEKIERDLDERDQS